MESSKHIEQDELTLKIAGFALLFFIGAGIAFYWGFTDYERKIRPPKIIHKIPKMSVTDSSRATAPIITTTAYKINTVDMALAVNELPPEDLKPFVTDKYENIGKIKNKVKTLRVSAEEDGNPIVIDVKEILKKSEHIKPKAPLKRYAVQVGAYKNPAHAEERLRMVKRKGFSGEIYLFTDKDGNTWHAVHIGAFDSFTQAGKMVDEYQGRKLGQAFIKTMRKENIKS